MTDLIRRADALEAVDVAMLGAYRPTFERVVKALRALPSVPTPEPIHHHGDPAFTCTLKGCNFFTRHYLQGGK